MNTNDPFNHGDQTAFAGNKYKHVSSMLPRMMGDAKRGCMPPPEFLAKSQVMFQDLGVLENKCRFSRQLEFQKAQKLG